MSDEDTLQQERYLLCLEALAECVVAGISSKAIDHIAFECGVSKRDLDNLFNNDE